MTIQISGDFLSQWSYDITGNTTIYDISNRETYASITVLLKPIQAKGGLRGHLRGNSLTILTIYSSNQTILNFTRIDTEVNPTNIPQNVAK